MVTIFNHFMVGVQLGLPPFVTESECHVSSNIVLQETCAVNVWLEFLLLVLFCLVLMLYVRLAALHFGLYHYEV
ncbi:hypothetical protein Csa_015148 [Cucumis sativus]|uniref:Uncharacterized protein n=1 Tax=Cucumis sativus TaxID=3659 RepID=A0A0A0KY42_CUCSA|nr:hypothetical protein Csa_015148 [Cucumis sativus]